jgi:hypothetical protein
MEFIVELARSDDDPAIRRLLAGNPVPGRITVTFEREPNYFLGCTVMGGDCQVLVARHLSTGELVGIATRVIRSLFINGRPQEVGYLSQLRVERRFRGRWLVSEGFRLLRQLHEERRVPGYITTLIEGNEEALGVLVTSPRPHFPVYREISRFCTLAIFLPTPRSLIRHSYEVCHGCESELTAIGNFLKEYGPSKQFFPVYDGSDFRENPRTRGFRVEDFLIVKESDRMLGVLGLWDQSSYKQTVVQSYAGWLGRIRPFYNVTARLTGRMTLPPPGQPVRSAYGSFVCVANDNPEVFDALLQATCSLAAQRGYSTLALGLSLNDPLLEVASRYRHIRYDGRLYTVCWTGEEDFHRRLDGRVPYMEIATL